MNKIISNNYLIIKIILIFNKKQNFKIKFYNKIIKTIKNKNKNSKNNYNYNKNKNIINNNNKNKN